jgi:diguanylate cyclase (GGDEF)-like protein
VERDLSIDRPAPAASEVTLAVRSELAGELGLEPDSLAGLDVDVAAVVLGQLSELSRQLGHRPELAGPDQALRDPHEAARRDLLSRALRDQLAEDLGVEPRKLSQVTPVVAAHSLLHLREMKRRLRNGQRGEGPEEEVPVRQDRRDVLGRVVREALAFQLGLEPSLLRGLSLEQAAAVLVRLIAIRRRLQDLERQTAPDAPAEEKLERRDVVARALRTVLADELEVHPRVLGGLSPLGSARVLTHVTAARRAVARMQNQVAVDELTGALRRAAGEARLEQEMRRTNRLAGGHLIIAFIDMDALKAVNDTSGHAAGDRLLHDLVATLRARLRSYDAVIRWGGDEFLCILPQTGTEAAEKVFAEVRDSFSSQTGQRFSIGFADLQEGDGISELVARADRDLYQRKASQDGQGPAPAKPAQAPRKPGLLARLAGLFRVRTPPRDSGGGSVGDRAEG